MLEKIIVLFILFALIIAFDVPKLKQKQSRDKLAYWAFMLIAVYFSVDFVSNLDMPRLHMVVVYLFSGTAEQITSYLKAGTS